MSQTHSTTSRSGKTFRRRKCHPRVKAENRLSVPGLVRIRRDELRLVDAMLENPPETTGEADAQADADVIAIGVRFSRDEVRLIDAVRADTGFSRSRWMGRAAVDMAKVGIKRGGAATSRLERSAWIRVAVVTTARVQARSRKLKVS